MGRHKNASNIDEAEAEFNTAASHRLPEANNYSYEEYEVRRIVSNVEGGRKVEFEKIKLLRKNVKIREDEAQVLNLGVTAHPENRFFSLYLLPDSPDTFPIEYLDLDNVKMSI